MTKKTTQASKPVLHCNSHNATYDTMRKNQLIDYLQSIPGNPEVLLWNSFVSDWHSIKPCVTKLTKLDKKYFLESCRLERCIDTNDWEYQLTAEELQQAEESYSNHEYEHNESVCQKDLERKRYKQKQVIMLQGKPRGVKTWDRLGNIEY